MAKRSLIKSCAALSHCREAGITSGVNWLLVNSFDMHVVDFLDHVTALVRLL